jgi:hypothetical protein
MPAYNHRQTCEGLFCCCYVAQPGFYKEFLLEFLVWVKTEYCK